MIFIQGGLVIGKMEPHVDPRIQGKIWILKDLDSDGYVFLGGVGRERSLKAVAHITDIEHWDGPKPSSRYAVWYRDGF